jgi:hypothetical protein
MMNTKIKSFVDPTGTEWCLNKKRGYLISSKRDGSITAYYVANPPAKGTPEHIEFIGVCEHAVSIGLLRPLKAYVVID